VRPAPQVLRAPSGVVCIFQALGVPLSRERRRLFEAEELNLTRRRWLTCRGHAGSGPVAPDLRNRAPH
jgi:hypothetical protein